MAEKLDLHKKYKEFYRATKKPIELRVPSMKYLTVEGEGKPGEELFQDNVGALYSIAYTAKFMSKDKGRDFKVPWLEGIYWVKSGKSIFDGRIKKLSWKLMIPFPGFLTRNDVDRARAQIRERAEKKKKEVPDSLDDVNLEKISEGRCVQVLHVGSYEDEKPTIDTLIEFAGGRGLEVSGHHHEIYLSDPRRVPPERLRTILRYPVRKAS